MFSGDRVTAGEGRWHLRNSVNVPGATERDTHMAKTVSCPLRASCHNTNRCKNKTEGGRDGAARFFLVRVTAPRPEFYSPSAGQTPRRRE